MLNAVIAVSRERNPMPWEPAVDIHSFPRSTDIDQSSLTNGQVRKLNSLRKSVGDDIAEEAFSLWMKSQTKTPKKRRDPVADALVNALDQFSGDKTFRLGTKGYVVKRSRGKGASGFVAHKVL